MPQAGLVFGSGMFVAGTHFHAKADLEVGHKITVINMAGTSWLLGIMANFRPLLAAVKRFHGDVDIQNPRQPQGAGDGIEDLRGEPVQPGATAFACNETWPSRLSRVAGVPPARDLQRSG